MDNDISPSLLAESLYIDVFGCSPEVTTLPGAGSDRLYFRLTHSGYPPVVATYGNDIVENNAFLSLARAFKPYGVNVPEIYAVSADCRCYLQQDLGDIQLLQLLSSDLRVSLSEKVLSALVDMQTMDEAVWGNFVCCRPFSGRLVFWDLNYFKYEFLKNSGIPFDENKLEDDFERMADVLTRIDRRQWGFMYRDFQSRNVMIVDGEPWWIDFQGGRKGPMAYDAVSFLWQSKAGFSPDERRHLLSVYAGKLASVRGISESEVIAVAGQLALLRTLQVLGAYGFRGLVEKKSHFIESIPGALMNLEALADAGDIDNYPEIKRIALMSAESRFVSRPVGEGLIVKVFSFSYKRGYPEDLSGNGGGFMFDCRGMHNPGRYEQYKPLTGLDREVRDFLEDKGEVQQFVDKALEIVLPSVKRYVLRGFNSLQVGFGCTGGRHRSVYCAQRFAESLARKCPDVRVVVEHREQGIIKEL